MLLNLCGIDKTCQTIGIIKVSDSRVTEYLIVQQLPVDRGGKLIQDEEDQYFNIKLVMKRTELFHNQYLIIL